MSCTPESSRQAPLTTHHWPAHSAFVECLLITGKCLMFSDERWVFSEGCAMRNKEVKEVKEIKEFKDIKDMFR